MIRRSFDASRGAWHARPQASLQASFRLHDAGAECQEQCCRTVCSFGSPRTFYSLCTIYIILTAAFPVMPQRLLTVIKIQRYLGIFIIK